MSPNFDFEFEKIYLIMGTEMLKCQNLMESEVAYYSCYHLLESFWGYDRETGLHSSFFFFILLFSSFQIFE